MYDEFKKRFQAGEWRANVFRDLVLRDCNKVESRAVILDIGCGNGFDGSGDIQLEIAKVSKEYIGIEPDTEVEPQNFFSSFHYSTFEECQLAPNSVDVAFCVMVLEHLQEPEHFLAKLRHVLKPGGVFWGFTMDRRHYFCRISSIMDRLNMKDLYLDVFRGKRGEDRYDNYPTTYLANSPRQINNYANDDFNCQFINFSKVGQVDYYLPFWMKPVFHAVDAVQMALKFPGSVLAVRMELKNREA